MDDTTGDLELDFQPVPGGMVDTARRQAAAVAQAAEVPAVKVPPVTVKVMKPDLFAAKTMTIGPGASALGMPADPHRSLGIINLITAAATVLIARDRASADTGTGFLLQSGQPMIPLGHGREVWLNNPGSASIQVSVLTESYSSE